MKVKEIIKKARTKAAKMKPSNGQAIANYALFNKEMQEYDMEMDRLAKLEVQLEMEEEFRKMEVLGQIANLERRRNNRMQMLDVLKAKYYKIGMRINRAKDYKERQFEICLQMVEMEAEVEEFGKQIEVLIEEQLAKI